jgi:hypothetical protein
MHGNALQLAISNELIVMPGEPQSLTGSGSALAYDTAITRNAATTKSDVFIFYLLLNFFLLKLSFEYINLILVLVLNTDFILTFDGKNDKCFNKNIFSRTIFQITQVFLFSNKKKIIERKPCFPDYD